MNFYNDLTTKKRDSEILAVYSDTKELIPRNFSKLFLIVTKVFSVTFNVPFHSKYKKAI